MTAGNDYQAAELRRTIAEFFAPKSSAADYSRFWNVPQPSDVQFVIATVPDPVHTHLALFFDRHIEAVQQAAQAQRFIFDRAVLPWEDKTHPEPDEFWIRESESKWQQGREKIPGLLIFRPAHWPGSAAIKSAAPSGPNQPSQPLFVFLVAETPTSGIRKDQFSKALEIMYNIRGNSVHGKLLLLGPTFSGSLYSLSDLLAVQDPRLPDQIVAHSQIATWAPGEEFKERFDSALNGSNKHLEFISFQESDRYQLRRLIEFAAKEGYSPDEIAVISEDETAYGNLEERAYIDQHRHLEPGFCLDAKNLEKCEQEVVRVYFPREISHLRAAYQQDVYSEEELVGTERRPRSSLRLNLETGGNDDDSVYIYAHKQMPLSQEGVLLGIVRSLREHRSSFIVLKATDPLDLLFLSRFFRNAHLEGRIITVGADQIFRREEEELGLPGVLSLTSYYLLPGMDELMPPLTHGPEVDIDRVFSSGFSAGVYNAMVSLIAEDREPVKPDTTLLRPQYSCGRNLNLPDAPYEEYAWPIVDRGAKDHQACLLSPPLYLTALGRGGYWPLAVLDNLSDRGADTQIPSRLQGVLPHVTFATGLVQHYHKAWELLCGFWILLAVAHLLFLRQGSILSRSEMIARFAPLADPRRSVVLATASGLLLALSVILLYITPETGWLPHVLKAVIVFLFVVPVLDLARRGTFPAAIVYLGTAIILVFLITRGLHALQQEPSFWELLVYRCLHPVSAVSPLLPIALLVATGYWWAWHSLSGLSLLDYRRPRLPKLDRHSLESLEESEEGDATLSKLLPRKMMTISEDEADKLISVARPFVFDVRIFLPILFLLCYLVFTLVGLRHPIRSLEGHWYDVFYGSLLAVFVVALLVNLLRLWVVWTECRRLLTALDRFPLRRAFGRLTGFSWKPIWRLAGSSIRDSYNLISRELESVSHLQSILEKELLEKPDEEDDSRKKILKTTCGQLTSKLPKIFKIYAEAIKEQQKVSGDLLKANKTLVAVIRDLQTDLADLCGLVLNFLSKYWDKETGFVAANHEQRRKEQRPREESLEKHHPSLRALAEEFVALVYVSFILNFLLRMRSLVLCVTGMFVLILASLNSYPIEPRLALHTAMIGLFVLIGAVVAMVYAEMHRNSTLSHVTDTNPGELGSDFWIKIAAFGAIPLLSLLATQFPEINRFLFSWFQPAMEAVK